MQSLDDLSEGASIDTLQRDEIDEDKFLQIVAQCMDKPNWSVDEMNESFCLYDIDGNGYVDPKEIRRTFLKVGENMSESEAEDQLREFDIDGDCQVRKCFKTILL